MVCAEHVNEMTKKETKKKLKALKGINLADAVKEGLVKKNYNLDDGDDDFYRQINDDSKEADNDK